MAFMVLSVPLIHPRIVLQNVGNVHSITLCPSPTAIIVCAESYSSEYFVAFGKNYYGTPDRLTLYLSSIEPGPVLVTVETLMGFSFSGYATNNETFTVEIPSTFLVASTTERVKGIRVTAENQNSLVVHGLNSASGTSDGFLAFPCNHLPVEQYEYYGLSYASITNMLSYFVIVACEDNTQLQIGENSTELNRMETYFWESESFSGTRVVSNKPLAVFVGNPCAFVPRNHLYCDHLIEQVPPTALWGNRFLSASLASRESGDLYRILASQASTSVEVLCNTFNDTYLFNLNESGSWDELLTPAMSYCSITASKPILVMQFALGLSADGIGDPFMMMITPVEQYRKYSIFNVPSGFNLFVTIYSASDEFQSNEILFDEEDLNNNVWNTVYCSNAVDTSHSWISPAPSHIRSRIICIWIH